MSSSFHEKRVGVREELARELRQFNGLAASFFRMAAAQSGMTVTDMQVLDILENMGPATAGQIADLTGLTTGAITGMLNRLEEAGLVSRERDSNDGRRVIVQLIPGKNKMHEIDSVFASIGRVWDEMLSHYDDEQLAFLLEFLKRSNVISKEEIIRLREAPEDEERVRSTLLGDLQSARLIVSSGVSQLVVHTGEGMSRLYQARFEGPLPDVKAKDGVVTIRYPRRLGVPSGEKRRAEVSLSPAIPWQIAIQGGVADITAELSKLKLGGLEIKGGLSAIRVELPTPEGVVPIRISGGASDVVIRRPAGIAARVHLKGWASAFIFDEQTFSNMGNDVRLQSPGYENAAQRYDIEVFSSVSMVSITSTP